MNFRSITIPSEMAIWGLNSGIPRSTASTAYTSTRVGAFIGYELNNEEKNNLIELLIYTNSTHPTHTPKHTTPQHIEFGGRINR
jgi:hypothetical protein